MPSEISILYLLASDLLSGGLEEAMLTRQFHDSISSCAGWGWGLRVGVDDGGVWRVCKGAGGRGGREKDREGESEGEGEGEGEGGGERAVAARVGRRVSPRAAG